MAKKIFAWEDCCFSPISLKFAINAIALIGCAEQSRTYHISGSDDISYAHFAQMLAIKKCGSDHLVKPVSRPVMQCPMPARHGSLSMTQAIINLGIKPQLPAQVLADICA